MIRLFLIPFFLIIAACARAPEPITGPVGDAWEEMLKISNAHANRPCRTIFSLRFGKEGDTRRVNALLWSNDNDSVRLDVSAGVGVTMAKILDRPGYFLLLSPNENKAYEYTGPNRPLLRIGAPLPFDLSRLTNILSGNYARAFAELPETGEITGSETSYVLPDPPAGTLELAKNGLPLSWHTARWNLQLSYRDNETTPYKLRLENTDGKIAILQVKERDYPDEPFTSAQTDLKIPPEAQIMPLSAYRD